MVYFSVKPAPTTMAIAFPFPFLPFPFTFPGGTVTEAADITHQENMKLLSLA
jgi:hypothetical protein